MKKQDFFFSIENNSYNEETETTERYVSGYYRTFDEVQRQIEMRAKIHDLDYKIVEIGDRLDVKYSDTYLPFVDTYIVRYSRNGNPVQPHLEGVYMPRFINTLKFN